MPKKSKKTDNPYKNLKEGAFTRQAKSAGMSVDKFAAHVIKNYKAQGKGHPRRKSKYNPVIEDIINLIRLLFSKIFYK